MQRGIIQLCLLLINVVLHCSCREVAQSGEVRTVQRWLRLPIGSADTLQIEERQYQSMISSFKVEDKAADPDILFFNRSLSALPGTNSEAAADTFYRLYAYLQQQNRPADFITIRDTLIRIYRHINSVFSRLNESDSHFEHLRRRIPGYATYDCIRLEQDASVFEKTYNIAPQRYDYLHALRQTIRDEIEEENIPLRKDRAALRDELLQEVEEIGSMLTSYFFLESAREFQYQHY